MRVLLVDALPLVYANFAKVGNLSVQNGPHAGTPTGLRFGFLRSVNSYRKRLQADRVVIAWDTQHPIKKAEGAESYYKAGRSDEIELGLTGGQRVNKDKMYAQIPDLKDMIGLTAWIQVECDGYEADDLIGHYSRELTASGAHKVFISTTDNDLCQLVNDQIKIFVPKSEKHGRKKDGFKDLDWVRNEFGGPTGVQLTLYRALVGDKSDNLPGVLLPEQLSNAKHLIREVLCRTDAPSNPRELINVLRQATRAIVADEIEALGERFELMFRVMSLQSPPSGTIRVRKGIKKTDQLQELFQKLEFNSMMKEIPTLCV
jgi:hypothetical protein